MRYDSSKIQDRLTAKLRGGRQIAEVIEGPQYAIVVFDDGWRCRARMDEVMRAMREDAGADYPEAA